MKKIAISDRAQMVIRSYLAEIQNGAKERTDNISSFKIHPARTSLTFPFSTKYSPIRRRKIIMVEYIVIGMMDKLYLPIKLSIGLSNITIAVYK